MSELDLVSLWISSMMAIATVAASWTSLRTLVSQTSPDIIMFIRPDGVSPSMARLVIRNLDWQLHPNTSHIHPHMCG